MIGDVHAEDERLEAGILALREAQVDVLVQVGDIVDGVGNVDRCVDLLLRHDVQTIAGNHERWFLGGEMRSLPHATSELTPQSRAFFEALPATRRFETPQGGLLVCHGVGENDMANLRPETRGYDLQSVMPALRPLLLDETLRFMVGGHTHQRMARSFENHSHQKLWIINAGTLHEHGPAGFVLLDSEAMSVRTWGFEGNVAKEGETLELA